MRKGEVIATIKGITFYYLCQDKHMTYGGKPCHFLTTDLKNRNAAFRVSPEQTEWQSVCENWYGFKNLI